MGVTRDVKKNEFFVCLPKKCWFGKKTMPQRYRYLMNKHKECETVQFPTALWLADEMRKNEQGQSSWKPYLEYMPTNDDYNNYHPAMARTAGKWALDKCVETVNNEKGLNLTGEEAVEQ